YVEQEEDLAIRKGVMFKSLTLVPYGRMQYVDVSAGPIARRMKIAQVQLHTASAATDASIPGLPQEEAARLRDQLSARGEAKLAGRRPTRLPRASPHRPPRHRARASAGPSDPPTRRRLPPPRPVAPARPLTTLRSRGIRCRPSTPRSRGTRCRPST